MCFEEMTSGHRLPKTYGKASGPLERPSARNIKEFTYTVKESGNVAGVDNDAEASKTFTVTVTDNGDGTLSVTSNPAQGALFSFTNTYSVDPEESSPTDEDGITITKNLTGRNLNEGKFTFELVDQSGTAVAMGTNDASGNVELGTVRFTEPGEFTYTVREANNGLGGVDYDAAQYKATAKVTDNSDGTLAVTWSFGTAAGDPASDIEFNNTYTATSTSVLLGGSKVLDGRALTKGEFEFQLADKDGNVLQTVSNAENGSFCFDSIVYDQAGTYEYVISEVKGDAEGVTYDGTTYAVRVVVTDNGKGQLQVSELTYNGEASLPVFHNTYVEPAGPVEPTTPAEPPAETIPRAGDATNTVLPAVIAASGITLAVAGSLVIARRRNK